jgi:DNA-binding MarR family transcriptional regulator
LPSENRLVIVQKNKNQSIDGELAELCKMMRIMSDRDTDGTLPQVLKVLMVESRGKPVGGSELSRASGINRITIIHHLKRLEGAGLVRRQEGKYILRVSSAEGMLFEFRKEMEQHFSEMDEIARQIDSQFVDFEKGIEARRRRIR